MSFAWMGVAAGFVVAALLGAALPHTAIDWQPALAATQPWRAFTAIAVHYSTAHLAANLAGAVLAALLGWAAQMPVRAAAAWLAAWPLTQLGLLLRPDLAHYGGLSGVLHAGIAIVAVWLVATGPSRARRLVGLAIVAGLTAKVLGEAPWGPALHQSTAWDIAVAPFAHLSGLVAGAACAFAALLPWAAAPRSERRAGSPQR